MARSIVRAVLTGLAGGAALMLGLLIVFVAGHCAWSYTHHGSIDPRCSLGWHGYAIQYGPDTEPPSCVYIGNVEWNPPLPQDLSGAQAQKVTTL